MTGPVPPAAEAAAEPARPLERLEPRVVVYWYLTDLASALFLCGLMAFGVVMVRQHAEDWAQAALWAAVLLGGLLLLWNLVAPPLAFGRWRFFVDDELLLMRYGIVFHEERMVPVRRMQHVDLMRGPIERLFGLATLVVFTAGNEGSAFRVPGLSAARAQALRDRILKARGDDVL